MSPMTMEQESSSKKSGLIFHAVTVSDHDWGKKPKSLEI